MIRQDNQNEVVDDSDFISYGDDDDDVDFEVD
jgi:hypothetical protein